MNTFTFNNVDGFQEKLLAWSQQFNYVAYLDSCDYKLDFHNTYKCIVAVSNTSIVNENTDHIFEELDNAISKKKWLFGYLAYDLKNEIENLQSNNFDKINIPNSTFFEPEILFQLIENEWIVSSNSINHLDKKIKEIQNHSLTSNTTQFAKNAIYQRIEKEEYLETISKIKADIENGRYYEINYCREFYSTEIEINPVHIYNLLKQYSPAPQSCFLKLRHHFLMSSSPERFLKKKEDKLIAQPMKGTIKRGESTTEDNALKSKLFNSKKDKAENVMIVDLMRNDLTKCSIPGSIEVDELFGIYTFPQVHTMISTISSKVKSTTKFSEIINATFPVGSMTGAPKVEVMKAIEDYEQSKRGLYAGAVGYISPNFNFDFNVVIRSILYNKENKYLSFQTGGAIVYDSDAESEWEETNLKAKALLEVLLS